MDNLPEDVFEVTVTIRNNRLKKRRLKLGFSQHVMAKAIGISVAELGGYETFKCSPIDKHGHWKPSALKTADYFEVDPGELWPDVIHMVTQSKVTKTMSSEEMGLFTGSDRMAAALPPSYALEAKELKYQIHSTLSELKPHEEYVIKLYFGLDGHGQKTVVEIANDENIMNEIRRLGRCYYLRDSTSDVYIVRHTLDKALTKLRHPSRANQLRPYIKE
jgi:transcriptional regulator with XRE-family HTH domain